MPFIAILDTDYCYCTVPVNFTIVPFLYVTVISLYPKLTVCPVDVSNENQLSPL